MPSGGAAASALSPARPRGSSSVGVGVGSASSGGGGGGAGGGAGATPSTPERAREGSVYASQSLANNNVNWMSSGSFWVAYVLAICAFRGTLFALLPKPYASPELEWTLTNVAHAVVSVVGLHWNRGSPIWADQGEHANHTVWEQIDNGAPWTPTHKFLLIVPVVLFLVSLHFTHYEAGPLVVNLVTLAVLVVPKLPEMHEFRLFGINSGVSHCGRARAGAAARCCAPHSSAPHSSAPAPPRPYRAPLPLLPRSPRRRASTSEGAWPRGERGGARGAQACALFL